LLEPLGHREEDAGEKRMTGYGLVSSLRASYATGRAVSIPGFALGRAQGL